MRSPEATRRRLTWTLFIGNAMSSTSFIAAITVAALAAEELTGSARYAGIPSALGTAASALGAWVLTTSSRRWGRRLSFSAGFFVSACGGAIAAGSLWISSLWVLLAGMILLGFGRSVSQLSRYAAGDLWATEKRASAIGFVVWAGTIGSVLGPFLVLPASQLGSKHLAAELAGPYVLCSAGFLLAALWLLFGLRPEPLGLSVTSEADRATEKGRPLAILICYPNVRLGLVALMVSQGVMVLVMTMTPVHVRGHGHGLSLVSGVMALHSVGMFVFSPLTGLLVDRWGGRRVIACGALLLCTASVLAAGAGEAETIPLLSALFLLGVGWNLGFVAASAVLQEGMSLADRLRLQGLADSLTWGSGGLAAFSSGFLLAGGSYSSLSWVAASLSILPLVVLLLQETQRRQLERHREAH